MSIDRVREVAHRLLVSTGAIAVLGQPSNCGPRVPLSPRNWRFGSGFKAYVSAFRATFPDLHATIEDQIVREDKVAMRFGFSAPMRPDSALSQITFCEVVSVVY